MFDLTSSKLLILGIVALIVVGPKELPFLLRTIGKYVGMIRRQANEFRAQFDEAMREAELDSIKKDLEDVARDAENTIKSAQSSFESDIQATTRDLDQSLQRPAPATPAEPTHTFDPLNGLEAQPVPDHISPANTSVAHEQPGVETAAVSTPTEAVITPPVPAPDASGHTQRFVNDFAKTGA